jgi:hypothetical protein
LWGCLGRLIHGSIVLVGKKLLVVFSGNRGVHEGNPDGQSRSSAGLFIAQRLTAVETNPNSTGDCRRKA